MYFEPNEIYHIYNQGNNRQPIFFSQENYLFFLRKMREFLLPFGDFLCYCLMPNHFHWLFYVRELAFRVHLSDYHSDTKYRSLNDAIGILLRSYTRAINHQENRTGALFREKTKAKNGWEDVFLLPSNPGNNKILSNQELYGISCFNYIHENPKRAGLVENAEDWPYSSCADFMGKRNGTLCNQALARELLGLP